MRLKFTCIILLLTSLSYRVYAQKENNFWAFGNGSGLDFNTSPPTPVPTGINTFEGCASICDASGNLLFYTNSLTVWDRTNNPMPNGSYLMGEPSMTTTQGAAISVIPGAPGKYYVFSLNTAPTLSLYYSMIDMTLNGGKGDVVSTAKNVLMAKERNSEKMAIVAGCGYNWLIMHHADSSLFYAYKITAAGIEPPVVSAVKPFEPALLFRYMFGELKASADGRLLALANVNDSTWIYNFDKKSGKVLDGFMLDDLLHCYSVEFSPDGGKLYAIPWDGAGIYQYDLSLFPDTLSVRASRYKVTDSLSLSLLRGADGKLYCNTVYPVFPPKLSRINKPGSAGAACDFESAVVALPSTLSSFYSELGNNTQVPLLNSDKTFSSGFDTILCKGTPVMYRNRRSSIGFEWNDGVYGPDRSFTTAGIYWVSSVLDCDTYIDTVRLVTHIDTMVHLLDTTLCFEDKVILSSSFRSGLSDAYLWNDGSTGAARELDLSDTLWVTVQDGCNCYEDTFRVRMVRFEVPLKDTFICAGTALLLDATVPNADGYHWQDGSALPTLQVTDSGHYTVTVALDGCSKSKTIGIKTNMPKVDLGPDRTLCAGEQVILQPDIPGATFLWQDNSTGMTYDVRESGMYSVTITSEGCQARDSVRIDFVRCDQCMVIPNAFTPNEDGRNDVFLPLFYCPVAAYSMQIFNRYGEAVFKTGNPAEAWTGSYRGDYLELGTYYYLVKVKFDHPDAKDELYKGDISLIR